LLSLPPVLCRLGAAHSNDLRAAASVGFRTAFVSRPLEFGPAGTADDPAPGTFDIQARDFLNLADQLGC
jgi:2-haloacid dehalogenase